MYILIGFFCYNKTFIRYVCGRRFQPTEEALFGALEMVNTGGLNKIEELVGIQIRYIHNVGQAPPALTCCASYVIRAIIHRESSHGARSPWC